MIALSTTYAAQDSTSDEDLLIGTGFRVQNLGYGYSHKELLPDVVPISMRICPPSLR